MTFKYNIKFIVSISTAIVLATILLTSNIFTTNVSAQTLPSSPCPPSGQVQHWDKIVFKVEKDTNNKVPKGVLDLKILDTPGTVMNLQQAVIDTLATQYGLTPSEKAGLKVEIKDVLYETVTCTEAVPQSFFDIFTERLGAVEQKSTDNMMSIQDLQQGNVRVDSFFDIFTERFGNTQNAIDSFFDIFTELRTADAQLQANIDAVKPTCPSNNVQHWDKIVFRFIYPLHVDPLNPSDPPLDTGRTYDIKVLDDPTLVADINKKIFNFLSAHYTLSVNDDELVSLIQIVNVDYAIVCAGM